MHYTYCMCFILYFDGCKNLGSLPGISHSNANRNIPSWNMRTHTHPGLRGLRFLMETAGAVAWVSAWVPGQEPWSQMGDPAVPLRTGRLSPLSDSTKSNLSRLHRVPLLVILKRCQPRPQLNKNLTPRNSLPSSRRLGCVGCGCLYGCHVLLPVILV